MDRIQPYGPMPTPRPGQAPAHAQPHAHATPPGYAADGWPAKTAADYVRAVRRRTWMILAVALPIALGGAVLAVRMAPVYKAEASIRIDPPKNDQILASILPHDIGGRDGESQELKYVKNQIAYLTTKEMAEQVLNEPDVEPPASVGGDPAFALAKSIVIRPVQGSNWYAISMEGPDPARTAKLLWTTLDVFRRQAQEENTRTLDLSMQHAQISLADLKQSLDEVDEKIRHALEGQVAIGPGGKSILQEQYVDQMGMLAYKRLRVEDLEKQVQLKLLTPRFAMLPPGIENRLASLDEQRQRYQMQLETFQGRILNFNSDPSVREISKRLGFVLDKMEQLKAYPAVEERSDGSEILLGQAKEEVLRREGQIQVLRGEMQAKMPAQQNYESLLDDRNRKQASFAQTEDRINNFKLLMKTQKQPVNIPEVVAEPAAPVRPNRPLMIALSVVLGLAAGVGSVCLLEHLDHSVKVPEHLTAGLTLPLLGVIPQIRRSAPVHRGGHLWTPGLPGSIEADAFRNLRASLLGLAGDSAPIVTLLVTSAKAGEGKSTTALNLAATCARAGERTLLVDVDLRRPSLADVFPDEDGHGLGLVDVLRDDLPWARAVIRTDLTNLDFLPTGDTTKIPVEVLGSLEMRQLLTSLAQSHYDRVILDGPAVLGLADCRMLGRMVDAALLVVKSGSLEPRPLQRAKAMLEQSRVPLAGVVFNGLSDDLKNWSSYGPYDVEGEGLIAGRPLDAPNGSSTADDDRVAALPAVVAGRS